MSVSRSAVRRLALHLLELELLSWGWTRLASTAGGPFQTFHAARAITTCRSLGVVHTLLLAADARTSSAMGSKSPP